MVSPTSSPARGQTAARTSKPSTAKQGTCLPVSTPIRPTSPAACAWPSGGPHVKVISGANQHLLFEFMAFDPSYTGGIFVAGGDLDGDGKAEIIASQGRGTGAVRTFSGINTHLLGSITPFLGTAADGVRVAAVDRDGDGLMDVVAGTGPFAPSN